jgi:hypothetical protein
MEPNAYGIVKNGKILFKYGFFPVDEGILSPEKNAENTESLRAALAKLNGVLPATFPTEGTSWDCGHGLTVMYRHPGNGKGRVDFSIENGMIRSTISEVQKKEVRISAEITLTSLADVAWEYLEKHFSNEKTVTHKNGVETVTFDLRGAKRAPIKEHVWAKYNEWVKETIAKRFTFQEDNEPCGVSLYDIVMYLFLGNDYPIQPAGLERPMRTAEVNQSKVDVKLAISTMRQDIETKCFLKATATSEEWRLAMRQVGSWVLNGELIQ